MYNQPLSQRSFDYKKMIDRTHAQMDEMKIILAALAAAHTAISFSVIENNHIINEKTYFCIDAMINIAETRCKSGKNNEYKK